MYKVGDEIISKKPHACGGSRWRIERVGADIKIKCLNCGHSVFLDFDKVKKMAKTFVVGNDNDDDKNS